MGIKVKCSKCGKDIEFPNCPNADTDKGEGVAFLLYSAFANDPIRKCAECKAK